MNNNVDPQDVINALGAKLANKEVELTMTQCALHNANQVIAKHGLDPAPDGQ